MIGLTDSEALLTQQLISYLNVSKCESDNALIINWILKKLEILQKSDTPNESIQLPKYDISDKK
jgi:hypothetical protein